MNQVANTDLILQNKESEFGKFVIKFTPKAIYILNDKNRYEETITIFPNLNIFLENLVFSWKFYRKVLWLKCILIKVKMLLSLFI